MNRIKPLTVLTVSLLTLPLLITISVEENEDFILSGRVTYFTRVSKDVVTQAKYSLTITNNLYNTIHKDVYLLIWQTNPDSVAISSTAVFTSHLESIGKYCLLEAKVTSKTGSNPLEISFSPSAIPISVRQEIYVNGVYTTPRVEGEYFFLAVDKGDTVVWKIKIENELEAPTANGTYIRPALPIIVKFYLDEKYLKKLEVSPETNSTILSESDSLNWHLLLRDSVDIYIKAQVSDLTEWGIIPTRSSSVEFDSAQYDYYIGALSSRRDALAAVLEAVKSILNGSEMISSGLYNISDVLEAIGTGVSGGGSATTYVGSVLTAASGQIQPMVLTLSEYSSLLKLMKNFSSRVDLTKVYTQINSSLSTIYNSLESSYKIVDEDLSRLLYINNTLSQLLQTSVDDTQRSALTSAIQVITTVYNNNLKLKDAISMLMKSIESLKIVMASINIDQISQFQILLGKLPDLSESFSKLAEQLTVAGDTLTEIGKHGKEAGKALCDIAAHIRFMTNMSLGTSSPLMGYFNNLSGSLNQMDNDLKSLRMGQNVFLFSAPRENLYPIVFHVSEPGTYNAISLTSENVTLVNYLAIPRSSFKNIKVLDETGSEINDLSYIGSWEHASLICIPVMQNVKNNNLIFASWGTIPFTLEVYSPSELILMTSEPIDTKHFEVRCSISLDQPMLVGKKGLIFIPTEPYINTTSQAIDSKVLYASILVPVVLVLIYFFVHERKKSIYKRRKSILERYESMLKADEQT